MPFRTATGGLAAANGLIAQSDSDPLSERECRIGFRVLDDGRKVRFFKSNGEQING